MTDKPNLRVLVVEDSEFDTRMLINLLRQGGYQPSYERVETSEEFRESLQDPSLEVILSDYNLPGFSALDALHELKSSGRDIPFIIVSGGIGEDTAVAAMKSGAHDYVMKGNLARLVPAVERELREAESRAARRKAEEARRESELRYRTLWENSTDAVLMMDEKGSISFANPAVESVFGYAQEDVVGKRLDSLLPDHSGFSVQHFIERLRAREHAENLTAVETVGQRADRSEVSVEIAFSDMDLHGWRWYVAFIRDVTARKKAEKELRETQEQFRVAREVQQRLFPKQAPEVEGLEIAGGTFPAEATGGDYFDYLTMLDGSTGIVVADVTGHGIGPALLMAETRAYLRILSNNASDTGDILSRTNQVLAEDVDYERYVTIALTKIDAENRTLIYSSAGHPCGFLLDANGEVRSRLRRTGSPLGIQPEIPFASSEPISLKAGDTVLLLTDGLEEAMSPDEEFFGIERVLNLVREHTQQSAREIVDILYQNVLTFSGDAGLSDDLTVVVIKVLS